MKRSQINGLVRSAKACFEEHGWALPPEPVWDVTDFGLGDVEKWGRVCVILSDEKEYAERLIYAREGMVTPAHHHKRKKEDLICRWGVIGVQVWSGDPSECTGQILTIHVNGERKEIASGDMLALEAGERITFEPGVVHEFSSASPEAILCELSTGGDEDEDSFYVNPNAGRYTPIEEDVLPIVKLASER